MLKRRLYLQIYGIILLSLAAVVIGFGILGFFLGPRDDERNFGEVISQLSFLALPPIEAPKAVQSEAVNKLGRALDMNVSLFDKHRRLIASYGILHQIPEDITPTDRWQKRPWVRTWVHSLPDGRWLAVDLKRRAGAPPIIRFAVFLAAIALAVGLFAYPFVRRLTQRLEQLQTTVEQMGSGDLKARAKIDGKDEVAALAMSFNTSAEKIEKLLTAHRLLLANASHELRTPLSRIRLGLEMLQQNPETVNAEDLRQDIAELDTLIDEILLMSRLDSGLVLNFEADVDLVALVAEECARFDDCHISASRSHLACDRKLIARLVRNLLQNADRHGKKPINVEIVEHNNEIVLTVKDAGDGFPDMEPEHLFRPFQRGINRQNIQGYGLGLALVKQIAEAHGGRVEIVPKTEIQSAVRVFLRPVPTEGKI